MSVTDTRASFERVRVLYETIEFASLQQMGEVYAADAYFRDPFNEVRGLEAIRRIFERMFEDLADCRFKIHDSAVDGSNVFMTWDMRFRIRRYRPDTVQTIHGATHLRFDDAGRIAYHRDYWDAADELYSKLPVIGPLMRWMKRRVG